MDHFIYQSGSQAFIGLNIVRKSRILEILKESELPRCRLVHDHHCLHTGTTRLYREYYETGRVRRYH